MTGTEGLLDRIRWAAFGVLRRGRPAPLTDLAARLHVDPDVAEGAARGLDRAGLLERDPDGTIVGAHGLTLLPTPHQLVLDGVELHTWCALDAIGIPAGLDLDAEVSTRCGWCQRPLRVRVDAGVPSAEQAAVVWWPTSPCVNVRAEFCPLANLFCDREHLESWHRGVGATAGEVLDLLQAAELGRLWWPRSAGCCDPAPPTGV